MSNETKGPQPPAEAQADEVVCLECGQPTMHMGQVCYACSHPAAKPAEAQAVLERIASKLRDAGARLPAPQVTGTVDGAVITGLSIALALVEAESTNPPPSAPVGVKIPPRKNERDSDGKFRTIYLFDTPHEQGQFQRHVEVLAQQPAADGGFTAADMMDARQEGRKEAQQAAGFSAGDMADASAQGFRAGAESVQQPAAVEAVEEALQRWLDWCDEHGEQPEAASGAAAVFSVITQQGGRSDD